MSTRQNVLLLIARLIVGGIFINAGWMKVSAMTETVSMFSSMGIAPVLTYIVSYAEFIGGILLVLGLWNTLVTGGLIIIMMGALYFTKDGGIQMFGFPLLTLASLLALCASGTGKFAIKSKKTVNI